MAKEQLSTYVPSLMKGRWQQLARQNGSTSAALLRAAVQQLLKSNALDSGIVGEASSGGSTRLHIRLRRAEAAVLSLAAERDGLSRQAVVLALIRAHLLRQPTPNASELSELRESNRQLAAIGRNLNQLAHAAHVDRVQPNTTGQTLSQLLAATQQLHHSTTALVRTTLYRWTDRDMENHDGE